MAWIAGVDGCKAGWIAAIADANLETSPVIACFARFEDIVNSVHAPCLIAIDMPIGLPDRIIGDGRGPEQAARAVLGRRRSSVFSMPSRAAVYAVDRPVIGMADITASHAEACAIARRDSDGRRGFSRQAFMILPKIREIDRLLVGAPALAARVKEVHPEVAFWSMNGGRPLDFPKRAPEGRAERLALLRAEGLPEAVLAGPPPRGAQPDDLLDALAGLVVAKHMHAGRGRAFPREIGHDRHGLEIAIWSFTPDRMLEETLS
ncbi:hypothetical protein IP69_13135 [Bosea sp. AAP35]|uniref:DUF429 domain-containing protein n=1 Tax=Bosea sp. AAP35 TaxID=1523417 RepID=UPI0006B92623|nr:DUF429 domain-containing protein [Bosea sp. AAP35]KPF67632.1 hypothetical protein IP69_13135 [Bosea sp. AAP35]